MHEKGPFSAYKSESKIELFERLSRPPAVAGRKVLFFPLQREEKYFVSRCDESIYTIPHSLFMQEKVLFLHLLKKLLCVTREQLTFSDSDDDFEHS